MRSVWALAIGVAWGCGDDSAESTQPDAGVVADAAVDVEVDAQPADAAVDAADSAVPDAAPVELPTPRFLSLPPTVAGPIWGYMVADVGDGTAYVFGGTNANSGGGDVFDGVRRLDANRELPSFVPVDAPGGPSARYCGCAAWDPVRERAVLSGGRDFQEVFAESWVFDPAGPTWTALEAEEHPNGPIGCALTYVPEQDAFILFGGAALTGSHGETWRLDADSLVWSKLDAAGPAARYDAELLTLPDGRVLMLGGGASAAGPMYRDVWHLDPAAEVWTQLEIVTEAPVGRRIPWVVVESATTALYGFGNSSMSPDDHHADLWRLDWVDGTWTRLDVEGPPRRGFARWLPGGEGALGLVLGGFDGRVPLSDQWVLMRR